VLHDDYYDSLEIDFTYLTLTEGISNMPTNPMSDPYSGNCLDYYDETDKRCSEGELACCGGLPYLPHETVQWRAGWQYASEHLIEWSDAWGEALKKLGT
jgi:hypothetical protein